MSNGDHVPTPYARESVTRNEKDVFRDKLRERLEPTLKMLDRNAPEIIVAGQFSLALEAMIGYAPGHWFDTQQQKAVEQVRVRHGLCAECGADMRAEPGYLNAQRFCESCERKLAALCEEVMSAG